VTQGRPKGVEVTGVSFRSAVETHVYLFQTTHKNVCTIMGMCKSIWAYVEADQDVQLGLMPFYHIFGMLK